MDQTKLESKIEVAANYISGFLIAWLTWTLLREGPLTWGWLTVQNGFAITSVFTVVSILRSYFWRRLFAVGLHRAVHQFVRRVTPWIHTKNT